MNGLKTAALLATLTALVLWAGQALGGKSGFVLALALAGVMNFAAYWWSDKIVLKMHGAKELTQGDAPGLYDLVRALAVGANLPMPRLYLIALEAPNAFATGRNPSHAAVAVTEGLLNLLNRDELSGVLAHELAHIKNRDTLVMTAAASIGGAISMLADMAFWGQLLGGRGDNEEGGHPLAGLVGIVVAPMAAMMIQMAISRTREFAADATGAQVSGKPLALASALKKIEVWSRKVPMETGTPATAHLFIINPFAGGGMAALFRTHPLTEERVRRLEAMVYGGGLRVG